MAFIIASLRTVKTSLMATIDPYSSKTAGSHIKLSATFHTLIRIYREKLGDREVVFGEGNYFCILKFKLVFVLIEIIVEKDIWLTLSRSENAIFTLIIFESTTFKSHFLPYFAIIRQHY